jgi:hypothetical protein
MRDCRRNWGWWQHRDVIVRDRPLCGDPVKQAIVWSWPAADSHSEDQMRTARPRLVPQPRSGCAQSAGQDGPLLYPGPLCGGVSGTIGRVAGVDRATAWMPELRRRRSGCPMSAPLFARTGVRSKSPASAHGLAAHKRAASAKWGVVFSWVLLFYSGRPATAPALLYLRHPCRRLPSALRASCAVRACSCVRRGQEKEK